LPASASQIGWDNNIIEKNGKAENIYIIELDEPQNKFITATITWNKHFEDTYPFNNLDAGENDLRLELWAVDADNPADSYLLDYSDSANDNVEHLFCKAEASNFRYELIVATGDGFAGNSKDLQRYGIAWKVSQRYEMNKLAWYDLDGNGRIDNDDLTIMLSNLEEYQNSPDEYLFGDINDDGLIDVEDVKVWVEVYSQLK